MKTLQQIILDADSTQNSKFKMIIDKIIPAKIIEEELHLLKKRNPSSLLTLLEVNQQFKMRIMAEVQTIEDIMTTAIFKSDFGHLSCEDVLSRNEIFPKEPKSKMRSEFKSFLKQRSKSVRMELNDHNKLKMIDVFQDLTLGGKLLFIRFIDHRVLTPLFETNNNKFTKKELIRTLEYSRKLRNFVVHSYFVLDEKPYISMAPNRGITNDLDKIHYIFKSLEHINKISGKTEIIKRIKKEIKKNGIKLTELDLQIFNDF